VPRAQRRAPPLPPHCSPPPTTNPPRSSDTLQNLTLELATMGDLKLVERLQQHTLAPGASRVIRANIKVSSTETGVIFGNIVYEGGGMAERGVVVLADIHIDIMDYIAPAACADVAFRNMWAEFEWENKARCACLGGGHRAGGVGV
jgi:coatomer subunit beta